jgi:hypothetical protein
MAGTFDASAGSPTGEPGRTRFIIGAVDPALLAGLPERLERHPDVRVDRVLRTSTGVGGLVVETTPRVAAELKRELGPNVVIEEDRVLDQLPPVVPGPGPVDPPLTAPPGCP